MKVDLSLYQNYSILLAAREFLPGIVAASISIAALFISDSSIIIATSSLLFGISVLKLFSVQHDCGHAAFSGNPTIDRWLGRICSLFTLIPFHAWRSEHAAHHGMFCNIEEKKLGDVYLMSKEQYIEASPGVRLAYRILRSTPVVLFVAPLFYIVIRSRLAPAGSATQWRSAISTSIIVFILYGIMYSIRPDILWPLLFAWHFAGAIGMVLFFNEHQFEDAVWMRRAEWSKETACISGSSVIQLPSILSWIIGHVEFHHIHHLDPRVPCYRLAEAFREFDKKHYHKRISPRQLLFPLQPLLWDDTRRMLIPASSINNCSSQQ